VLIDEGFAGDQAGLALLLRSQDCGVVATGCVGGRRGAGICLQRSTGRALAAGATDEEIADALLHPV
jgi:hypothetical protein